MREDHNFFYVKPSNKPKAKKASKPTNAEEQREKEEERDEEQGVQCKPKCCFDVVPLHILISLTRFFYSDR